LHSRSAAQQIDHWARIGQALEASPRTTHEEIEAVLRGQVRYDDLDDGGQAIVRARWDAQLAEDLATADFTEQLDATGIAWAEADADGVITIHDSASPSRDV
jgi:hypothetical protein